MPPRGRAEGALLADKGDRTLLAVGLGVAAHGLGHVGDGGRRSWWRDGRGEALGGAEHSGGVRGVGGGGEGCMSLRSCRCGLSKLRKLHVRWRSFRWDRRARKKYDDMEFQLCSHG
jgi:hypothetical protein